MKWICVSEGFYGFSIGDIIESGNQMEAIASIILLSEANCCYKQVREQLGKFKKHFELLARYRQKRIDEILNDN